MYSPPHLPPHPIDHNNNDVVQPQILPIEQEELHSPLSGCRVSDLSFNLCPKKWKKGKYFNDKKQQMFEKKMQSLIENLNIIPFTPHMNLDFSKYESLLKNLGLWDFVNLDLDTTNLRKDLIAQLVATYDSHGSYVNGYHIGVNRVKLARALNISTKEDRGNVQIDMDFETLSQDSIDFMLEFVSDRVVLQEDTLVMPVEVMDWIDVIKSGHPERVDWVGLIWFMVEKELVQGENLRDCYYASHLQCLMKEQKVFLREESDGNLVEMNKDAEEVEEDNVYDDVKCREEEMSCEMGGPCVELALGQDEGEKGEEIKDEEIMDIGNCKEKSEEDRVNEQEKWLMNGKNDMEDHYLQHCDSVKENEIGDTLNGQVEELEEANFEEAGDRFNIFPNDALVGEGFTGNFLQAMETNQIAFVSQGQEIDVNNMDPGPSFLNGSSKRATERDNVMFDHSLDHNNNKRLRINDLSNQNPVNSGTCMENLQQMVEQARIFNAGKEREFEEANLHKQMLLNELQKRDNMIEILNKSRIEDMQKKDDEIFRYERELHVMGNLLAGYKKAVKERQKAFDEYREKVKLPEEPAYKNVAGGLMLSTGEIERIRKEREEEFQMNCLIVEQRMKEAEKDFVAQFDAFLEKIHMMDKRLTRLDADAKEVIGLFTQCKVLRSEGKMLDVAEAVGNEEKAPEVAPEAFA